MLAGSLAALSLPTHAQLLRGTFTDNAPESVIVAYSPSGNVIETDYREIPVQPDGTFAYDMQFDGPFADVTVQVGDAIFGAHLAKGQTVEVAVTPQNDGTMACAYSGAMPEVNRFYNRFTRAFDGMRYFSMDPAQAKSNEEYAALLASETDSVRALLPVIADASLRQYYARMTEASNRWQQIRLLMDKAEAEGVKVSTYPAYQALIDSIDVNDEVAMRCNLSNAWLTAKTDAVRSMDDLDAYYREYMSLVDKYVTNPVVRRAMGRNVGYFYFAYGSGEGDYEKFWADYKQFMNNDPTIVAAYEPKVAAWRKTKKGGKAFDTTMTAPDGSVCRLSDFFGKFLYIDVWATWCAPCCAEIPHLEKLVERFKGNDKVEFISISIDTNQKAWHKKLEADKPAWKQFILSKAEADAFMQAWGIGGIPRFIMIDKAGNIFSADASRPSEEATPATIEAQTSL